MAHTLFRLDWTWNGEEAVLQSRCTDERGDVQPTIAEIAKFWGIAPKDVKSWPDFVLHFNAIWMVDREGDVHNALFS